jgi:hypothetical protein
MSQRGRGEERPDAPERAPESATFETTSVAARRARPPMFIAGFLVVLGAMIAVSVGSRGVPAATAAPAALGKSPAPSIAPTPAASATAIRPIPSLPDVLDAPVMTSGPGDIQLLARRARASIFVHGDVFIPKVTWVFVSLQDDSGNVAGWASVSVPGSAGPGVGAGPTLRFDVELAVPDAFAGRLWISANAYDSGGSLVSTTRMEMATILRSRLQFEP